jgi:hypothetical protein
MPYFEFGYMKQKRQLVSKFRKAEKKNSMVLTRRHLYSQSPASHIIGCEDAWTENGRQATSLTTRLYLQRAPDHRVPSVVFELGTEPDKCCISFKGA